MLRGDEMQKVLQDDYGMIWMFGSFSLVWTALVRQIVPETKGLSLEAAGGV